MKVEQQKPQRSQRKAQKGMMSWPPSLSYLLRSEASMPMATTRTTRAPSAPRSPPLLLFTFFVSSLLSPTLCSGLMPLLMGMILIKLLFRTGFDEAELKGYTPVIHANVYETIKILYDGAKEVAQVEPES
ncbi:hypothetical protein ZWY2020_015120 [Hordeum vulgare]|nr:hypothetical protein ZWY2020_015120 [Hordeum vulgare]